MALTVTATNFGPLANGKIVLKPLTVLIGPNNAGKSFMAMLAYTALHGSVSTSSLRRRSYFLQREFPHQPIYLLNSSIEPIKNQVMEFIASVSESGQIVFAKADSVIVDYIQKYIDEELLHYARGLGSEIERCFGSKL